ncbi:MAG: methyltransferase domain-containing protein [Patescibacteria group bacterium]|nr:methyltransferase domain-containing protein [Patescibacteria group bacterium]MDE1965649.1 methyltransferase domain-containing protein [Patescibacteria group bacterium]
MDFSDPKANILQLGLREGMRVCDIGAGSGHYAVAAGNIVGEDGKVYAVDVQEDILKHVRDHAKERGLHNVETIWGDAEKVGGTTLRDHVADAVILSNTLFQLERRDEAVKEIRRILRPGGKLLVIDWAGAYGGMGPSGDRVVTEYAAEDLFIGGGFHKLKDFRAGPHHYGIVFTAP